MAKPFEVTVIPTTFQRTAQIIQALETVSTFSETLGMGNLLPGGKSETSQLINAISQMSARIESGLAKIADNVGDTNRVLLWRRNREKLIKWNRRIGTLVTELESLKQSRDSNGRPLATIVIKGEEKPIEAWWKGDKVLGELYEMLGELGTMLAQKGDGNPIFEWDAIAEAGTAERVFGMKGETRFTLMLDWYLTICGMVQSITYLRNAALALYAQWPTPGRSIVNLDDVLDAKLGRMSYLDAEGKRHAGWGAWKVFEDTFEEILAEPMLDDSACHITRTSVDPAHGQSHFSDDHILDLGGIQLRPEANAYLAGLRIVYHAPMWTVAATVVRIDEDRSLKVAREVSWLRPGLLRDLGLAFQADWTTGSQSNIRLGRGERLGIGNIAEPICGSHNSVAVITGCSAIQRDGAWMLAFVYSEMTIAADGKMTIAPFPDSPAWNGTVPGGKLESGVPGKSFRLTSDVDELHRGTAELASLTPMTSATFDWRGNSEVSLRARFAWRIYRADVFQPTSLKRFSPPAVRPPALPRERAR